MQVFAVLGALGLLFPTALAQEPGTPPLSFEGDTIVFNLPPDLDPPFTLKNFIAAANEITGINFTLHDQAAQHGLLDKALLLHGEKRIPREDFFSFFQSMMKINQFVCVPQGAGHLEVIMITPVNATTSAVIQANARFVEWEDAVEFADQPGIWVVTVIPLKHASAQSLGTSLRTALSGGVGGARNDAFMPIPGENALLIQNYGPFVAAAVQLVNKLDVPPDPSQSKPLQSSPTRRPEPVEEPAEVDEPSEPAATSVEPESSSSSLGSILGGLALLISFICLRQIAGLRAQFEAS